MFLGDERRDERSKKLVSLGVHSGLANEENARILLG
jgi:hypothetical protein